MGNAVEFLNKALPAGIQMNATNAKMIGVDSCLNATAGALDQASNTLNCAISAVNHWSGAKCAASADRTQWFPVALGAWEKHLSNAGQNIPENTCAAATM